MREETFRGALSNGACGDVNNIDVIGQARPKNDRYQHTERVAARVAAAAFWRGTKWASRPTYHSGER